MAIDKTVNKTIDINAPASSVWRALTSTDGMQQWLSDMPIHITCNWKPGSAISFEGVWEGVTYTDKGTILKMEAERVFTYNYWSWFSRIPDMPENYSVIEFILIPTENTTTLQLTHRNFMTEAIYGHTNYYWVLTLDRMKKFIENHSSAI